MKNDTSNQLLAAATQAGAPAADTLVPITVAHGDGIGPEIMEATLKVLMAAGARIAPETIDIGEKLYISATTAKFHVSNIMRKLEVSRRAEAVYAASKQGLI